MREINNETFYCLFSNKRQCNCVNVLIIIFRALIQKVVYNGTSARQESVINDGGTRERKIKLKIAAFQRENIIINYPDYTRIDRVLIIAEI